MVSAEGLAVIYVFAGYAIASLALVGALVYGLVKAKSESSRAADLYREQERRADSMQDERDEWKQRHDVVTQQLSVAKVRLATAEAQRNVSAQAATTALVEKVKASNASTAADVLNALLGMPVLSAVPQAGDAGTSDGDRGAAGVRSAGAADAAHEARRLPES